MAKWVCPQCRTRFPYVAGREPECPDCGYALPDRSGGDVVMPFISLKKNRSADDIYRAEERAAKHRAEVAAEMTGQPLSDMSAMIPTNQRDGLREGDVSAPKISSDNQVAAAMAAAPPPSAQAAPLIGDAGASAGLMFSQSVSTGKFANMGARMQQKVREMHPSMVSGHAGAVTSDMPANEISNPLYRRRV